MGKLREELDSFRSHVHNPGELMVVLLMLAAFFVGLGVWGVVDCLQPVDKSVVQEYRLSFHDWEIDNGSVVLSSDQMREPFIFSGYEDYISGFDRMVQRCDGNTVFSVWAKWIDRDSDPIYLVYAISSDGEVYQSFEDYAAYRRSEIPLTVAIFGAFLLFILAFAAVIFKVGSHPEKFPRWVVYCCFKKDAIDI